MRVPVPALRLLPWLGLLALVLLSSWRPLSALGQTVLVSPSGYSLSRPLRLEGRNVGEVLVQLGSAVAALQSAVERQQGQIDELLRRNTSLSASLTQCEQRYEALQLSVTEQAERLGALLTPRAAAATAGSGEATVRWSLGTARVVSEPSGLECQTDGLGQQECTVPGLSNGQPYTFRVELATGAGLAVSEPSNSVTPMLECHPLLVAVTAPGDGGSLTSSPANSAGCAAGWFTPGAAVTLTAVPEAGFGVAWSGAGGQVAADGLSLSLTQPVGGFGHSFAASFRPCFPLNVSVAAGAGAVGLVGSAPPQGCPSGQLTEGSTVVLKATPDAGWTFLGWSGAQPASFQASALSFTMPASAAVQRATFAQCRSLTLLASPADCSKGTVASEPASTPGCGAGEFAAGSTLTLIAYPTAGNGLVGWAGAQSSAAGVWSYTMGPAAATQTATFAECRALSLTVNIPVGGKVVAIPPNSYGCASSVFAVGASVSVAAVPTPGFAFDNFTGLVTSTSSPVTLVMPAAASSLHATVRLRTVQHAASAVYGQPNFTSATQHNPGLWWGGLSSPGGVAFDSANRMYIADLEGSRVLVFEDGSNEPSRVIGQDDFFSFAPLRNRSGPDADTLGVPYTLDVDAHDGLYVADTGSNRVLYFPFGASNATRVYGQESFTAVELSGIFSARTLALPVDVVHDSVSDGVFVTDYLACRVLYYPPNETTASRVYGQPNFTTNLFDTGAGSLWLPAGLAVDSSGGLFISDFYNNRVVFCPPGSSVATQVYGQPDLHTPSDFFASINLPAKRNGFTGPYGMALRVGDGLYVADINQNRVLRFPVGEGVSGLVNATAVWGQPEGDFTAKLEGPVTAASLREPRAVRFDRKGRMFVADQQNHRVLRYDLDP